MEWRIKKEIRCGERQKPPWSRAQGWVRRTELGGEPPSGGAAPARLSFAQWIRTEGFLCSNKTNPARPSQRRLFWYSTAPSTSPLHTRVKTKGLKVARKRQEFTCIFYDSFRASSARKARAHQMGWMRKIEVLAKAKVKAALAGCASNTHRQKWEQERKV